MDVQTVQLLKGQSHMNYLRVKNWEQFQNYKDREPKWIKLHRSLLDDYEYNHLADAAKSHLIGIWLLAAKLDNKIPCDAKWIASKIGAESEVQLTPLLKANFLEPYESVQNCTELYPETETETEERQNICQFPPTTSVDELATARDDIAARWAAVAASTELENFARWTDKRKTALRQRWKDAFWREHYAEALDLIPGSEFLRGYGSTGWRATIDWFLKPESVVRIIEGKYHKRKTGLEGSEEIPF